MSDRGSIDIIIHTYTVSDYVDPDVDAIHTLYSYKKTAIGQWLDQRCELYWCWQGWAAGQHVYEIRARIAPEIATEYYLRWR